MHLHQLEKHFDLDIQRSQNKVCFIFLQFEIGDDGDDNAAGQEVKDGFGGDGDCGDGGQVVKDGFGGDGVEDDLQGRRQGSQSQGRSSGTNQGSGRESRHLSAIVSIVIIVHERQI